MRRRRAARRVAAVLLLVTIPAAAGASTAGDPLRHEHLVAGYQYLPSGSTWLGVGLALVDLGYPLRAGDTIAFTNIDPFPHTVTSCDDCLLEGFPSPSGDFNGSLAAAGGTFTLDTDGFAAGTYTYFCTIHSAMRGSFMILP